MKNEDATESHLTSSNSENEGKTLPAITPIKPLSCEGREGGSRVREVKEALVRGRQRKLSCEESKGGSRVRETKEALT